MKNACIILTVLALMLASVPKTAMAQDNQLMTYIKIPFGDKRANSAGVRVGLRATVSDETAFLATGSEKHRYLEFDLGINRNGFNSLRFNHVDFPTEEMQLDLRDEEWGGLAAQFIGAFVATAIILVIMYNCVKKESEGDHKCGRSSPKQ